MTEYCEICGEELSTNREIEVGVCNYCSVILAGTDFEDDLNMEEDFE